MSTNANDVIDRKEVLYVIYDSLCPVDIVMRPTIRAKTAAVRAGIIVSVCVCVCVCVCVW